MDGSSGTNERGKRGLLNKTWERCRSIRTRGGGCSGHRGSSPPDDDQREEVAEMRGSRRSSWPAKGRQRVAPEGCFPVYVGPEKQRFVVKTEHANHPLFKMLLEEARMEYGYSTQGPLLLPCDARFFYRVLMEMDSDDDGNHEIGLHGSCGMGHTSYRQLSPSPAVLMNDPCNW